VSLWRVRIAMWTDLIGVSGAVFADSNVTSPAYLVFLVIILGNGMRYGLRAFAEAATGSLLVALAVVGIRFADSLQSMTMVGGFFLLFVTIIVLYSYALMSNIERARAGLEAASRNDSLTGLLNRRGLYERSQPLFDGLGGNGAPHAILFADLDGFKAVNDHHGHDVGDRVLQRVAQAIAGCIRVHDLAARFGGDEFVVIMPQTTLAQATIVAKRLQGLIADVLVVGDASVSLTIGVGEAPAHGRNLDEVLRQVDLAMYQGKQAAGKGGIQLAMAAAAAT
jgi:diguanylate cyclase (GGDEF)-like protein